MEPKYLVESKKKYDSLTKGLKKVADNLFADPMTFAIHPAKKSGEIIGVSETMIIRFCHEIGYKGFKDFQFDVREYLLNHMQETTSVKNDHPLFDSMLTDIAHLNRNIEQLDVNLIEQAVNMIMSSKKRLIVGHYQSFTFAHWLSINLQYLVGDTILYRAEEDFQLVEQLPEESIVIAFSFFRYATDTLRLAEKAKNRGLKVIAITDTNASPIVEFADVVIPLVFTRNRVLIHKSPITMSFLNVLLFEVMNVLEREGKRKSISGQDYKYYINEGK
ncbi:MurR/RpiR family transcriptional regulator [Sporosarcina pasteurii]|uniref:Uncharacterized HTH-type transcriptional regulator ybbH n=1 Tax=Sporosarcina pasteurii TaxID=1474 RepID=A0A380BF49_SPOPA|nr:MurR/RpiR family transcriptional regulator [Sporosarcina pasteurii]MDS9472558.1 MurR/RpiR family transcriptional regulator [Sporosarcina pasteurii]QBQ06111.1 MurR/RpiR family transcriptional regulator [Sporosarcina pasteurii]SUI99410.1 Uncharacterized HTH-type transcriptional regulator ybbH [Sporosarcina pasteurii]